MDKVALGQVFLLVPQFFMSVSFHHYSILIRSQDDTYQNDELANLQISDALLDIDGVIGIFH